MADYSELMRLAEAATNARWQEDDMGDALEFAPIDGEDQAFILAASPVAVFELIAELEKAQAERDQLRAEVEGLRRQVDTLTEWYANGLNVINECSAVLPGAYYMDPPDGGDVSVAEQLRRMGKDAARYRWIRMADRWAAPLCVIRDPSRQAKLGSDCPSRDRLDDAVDEAMAMEAPHA